MRQLKCGQWLFRIWIASYEDWRPMHWSDVPLRATAMELVEDAAYSADEASLFLEGFNSSMLAVPGRSIWAVAVPIVIRYEGDIEPGASVRGFSFATDQPTSATA